ncbi:putative ferredoxin [Mycobacterium ulcerans str. Harvey]|uniref:Ferredoxin n=1 Tax=Mycobacterium ulcerans str. Harvey TaxID=1299332 RepID=A0ABP3AFF8_MYCUL|nr:putative ferredoxin [Mycobacterium ulcerans str. Harvey]
MDVAEKSCTQECPVACKTTCRVGAIYWEEDLPDEQRHHLADNAAFFREILPGRDAPLGSPGGADTVERIGVDTPLIAAMPPSGL